MEVWNWKYKIDIEHNQVYYIKYILALGRDGGDDERKEW